MSILLWASWLYGDRIVLVGQSPSESHREAVFVPFNFPIRNPAGFLLSTGDSDSATRNFFPFFEWGSTSSSEFLLGIFLVGDSRGLPNTSSEWHSSSFTGSWVCEFFRVSLSSSSWDLFLSSEIICARWKLCQQFFSSMVLCLYFHCHSNLHLLENTYSEWIYLTEGETSCQY